MNLWRIPVDPDEGRTLGQAEPVTTPSAFVAHPSVSGDGKRIAYTSVLMTQNIERATLDSDRWEVGDPVPLTSGSRQWSSPDPSPDGEWVAFYSRDLPEGDLYVVRGDGTGLRQVTGDSAIDRVPRWSPDGSRLAYFSNRSGLLQTWLVDSDGSGGRQFTFGDGAAVGGWSPDGSLIAINNFPEGVLIADPDVEWSEQTPERMVADSTWGVLVANDWSADGEKLAVMIGYSDEGVGFYDLKRRVPVRVTDFGQWPVWLPDSRHLLFVSGANAFYVVDSETGEVHTVYSVTRDVLGPPRVTADGSTMVYSRRVTEGDIWMVTIQ
jgi:Tol biopolymer transport system component